MRIETEDAFVGVIPEPYYVETALPNVDAAEKQVVTEGLYALEAGLELDVMQYFDTADELLERHAEPLEGESELIARIRAATPPFVLSEHAVLRRFRAL
jgi:hypothetical protein